MYYGAAPLKPPDPPAGAADGAEDVHGLGVAHVVLGVEENEAVRAAGEKRGEPGLETLAIDCLAVQADPALSV